ncbi:PD-(D/E)XK nuclease family protein [Candidatus Stoquefichus sp. SB1]|uniref:PD-(D/E)XK nuclease family protein n=1 Tax=Candidatus Stoquefichus sp. SB1 TaxID=1658109 RepID=UPI00067E83C0|nr:PD-(D/E)XK nuclease family protein [Candidatus Stoquefichus sp. SB1]
MRIINGLNYSYKLKEMVKECYMEAMKHPFETYQFVAEDPYVVEQLFFEHTHCLVNIEIMSWSKFIQQLIIENHLTKHHVLTHTEWVYYLRDILKTHQFHCFSDNQPYPLIDKFIPLMKAYDLNHTIYSKENIQNPKLKDFMHLYQALKNHCGDFTHITSESLLNQQDFYSPYQHIYIEADHHIEATKQMIIHHLAVNCDVTLLYTHLPDSRLMNLPFHELCKDALTIDQATHLSKHLFTQSHSVPSIDNHYFTFVAPTPHQEVKRVIYTIQQKIVDEGLHYCDFMIVYPNSSYVHLLIDTLTTLQIPHLLPITTPCLYDKSYQTILSALDHLQDSSISQIAHQLHQEELDKDYYDYLEGLYAYQDNITSQEFKDFFIATYINNHQESSHTRDQISICPIDKAKTAKPQHIFFLGLNETIFPALIKDTGLLLDEDIESLRKLQITTLLNTTEQLGAHHNDILKALLQPAISMTFSYSKQTLSGETLLESSLYKELSTLLTLQPLDELHYLPLDDYYLMGGLVTDKELLNKNIQDYIHSHNQPIQLSHDSVKKLYSPTLSVSQIETYNKCPFQYFIQYGLGIYPMKDQQLLPNELGSLVHYVLSINIDQQMDIETVVNQYILQDKNLQTKISNSYINQYFIEQLKKDLEITLTVLKRQLKVSQFQVHDKEKKVQHDIQGMHFKGFVDRIDEYQNYVSIIDYKSSAKDIDINLAMQGFNIQMLLYLKMVTELYQKDPGAVLYFNTKKRILSLNQNMSEPIDENEFYKQYRFGGYVVDDESHTVISAMDPTFDKKSDIINVTYVKSRNEYKGQILTPQQLECLLAEIEKHIYTLYLKMLEGCISITPKGSDQSATHASVNPCRYCQYHSICGFDVFYNDYEMVEFLDIDAILGGEEDAV